MRSRSPACIPRPAEVDDARVAKLIELTERYCVVFQTLAGNPALTVDWAAVRA